MSITNIVLYTVAGLFYSCGCFIFISCFVGAIIRDLDIFAKVHAIKISIIHGTTFLLMGILILNFTLINAIHIALFILVNILCTIATFHSLSRVILNNNIKHNAISRKKYEGGSNTNKEEKSTEMPPQEVEEDGERIEEYNVSNENLDSNEEKNSLPQAGETEEETNETEEAMEDLENIIPNETEDVNNIYENPTETDHNPLKEESDGK